MGSWRCVSTSPQELDALLWYNGFAIEHKYGEDRRPFDAELGMQYFVLKLRG